MPYLGNPPAKRFTSLSKQTITGDGGTAYTLDFPVGSDQDVEVFVNNVRQEPSVAYTVSGTSLTMTGAVQSSDDFYVVFQGKAIGTVTHPAANALQATSGTFTGNVDVNGTITASSITQNSGPAFSVYQATAQTLSSNTQTKIVFDTEEFDTDNCFDSTTNYRFTPNVAGYYLVSGKVQPAATYTAGVTAIYKNGTLYRYGSFNNNATGVAQPSMSCLVYLNGTTDYVEFYASFVAGQATSSVAGAGTAALTWFQGHLARAA